MPVRITGLPAVVSGATVGVEASSPPNITQHRRDPISTDYYNFNTGDLWLNSQTDVQTPANSIYRLWVLMAKANFVATWVLIINGSGGPIVALQPAINGVPNGAVVTPTLGIIQINNTDSNIVPVAGVPNPNNLNLDFANTIQVKLNIFSGIAGGDGNLTAFSNTTGLVQVVNYAASAQSGMFQLLKRHGTIQVPLAITSGDSIGSINFGGWDGDEYVFGASISSVNSGTVGNDRVAGNLIFATHPDAMTTHFATPRMVINPDGSIFTSGQDVGSANTSLTVGNTSGGTGKTLNLASTYNTAVGATQAMMVIDNSGFVGTNGSIAPGFGYSVGVFTPGITVGGSIVGITYSSQNGNYTRIGNCVAFALTIAVTSIGALTGDLSITGLPFATANFAVSQDCMMQITNNVTLPANKFYLWASPLPTTTNMLPQAGGNGAQVVVNDTFFSGTFTLTVTGTYFAV